MKIENDNHEETHFWSGSPSQWVNFNRYLLCGVVFVGITSVGILIPILLFLLIIPVSLACAYWLSIRSIRYEITDQRIIYTTGIFNRTTHFLEFFRVRDIKVDEPFGLRIVGRCNIYLLATDLTTPELKLWAVTKDRNFYQRIRQLMLDAQDKKNVRFLESSI